MSYYSFHTIHFILLIVSILILFFPCEDLEYSSGQPWLHSGKFYGVPVDCLLHQLIFSSYTPAFRYLWLSGPCSILYCYCMHVVNETKQGAMQLAVDGTDALLEVVAGRWHQWMAWLHFYKYMCRNTAIAFFPHKTIGGSLNSGILTYSCLSLDLEEDSLWVGKRGAAIIKAECKVDQTIPFISRSRSDWFISVRLLFTPALVQFQRKHVLSALLLSQSFVKPETWISCFFERSCSVRPSVRVRCSVTCVPNHARARWHWFVCYGTGRSTTDLLRIL